MQLNTIQTKKEYLSSLTWIEKMFDKKVKANSPAGEKIKIALLLIKDYEDKHYAIPSQDAL